MDTSVNVFRCWVWEVYKPLEGSPYYAPLLFLAVNDAQCVEDDTTTTVPCDFSPRVGLLRMAMTLYANIVM